MASLQKSKTTPVRLINTTYSWVREHLHLRGKARGRNRGNTRVSGCTEYEATKETGAIRNQELTLPASKIYTPLREKEIRLVKLHAGHTGHVDSIHCTLIHGVSTSEPYEALSYTWGSQDQSETILLNSEPFRVTQNLHQALLRLRHPTEERTLWIDALTINQNDVQERNSQVAKMAEIYSNAIETIVWLGEGLDEAGDPDRRIHHILEFLSNVQANHDRDEWVDVIRHVMNEVEAQHYKWYAASFQAVTSLPYWRRVWVLQEIMHSKTALLVCGPHRVSFDLFQTAVFVSYEIMIPRLEPSAPGLSFEVTQAGFDYCFEALDYSPGNARKGRLCTIHDWVARLYLWRNCADPRDKIFGFYHCFEPELRSKIIIDYSLKTSQVFTAMMRLLISLTGHLDFLCRINRCVGESKEGDEMPSWVLDFGQEAGSVTRFGTAKSGLPAGFRVAPYEFSDDGTVLHVKGFRLGIIANVSPLATLAWEEDRTVTKELEIGILDHLIACGKSLKVQDELVSAFIKAFTIRQASRVEAEFLENLIRQIETPAIDCADGARASKGKNVSDHENVLDLRLIISLYHDHNRRRMFTMMPDFSADPDQVTPAVEFGIGTLDIKPNDEIYLVAGCSAPLVVRTVQEQRHVLVGSADLGLNKTGGMVMLDPDVDINWEVLLQDLHLH